MKYLTSEIPKNRVKNKLERDEGLIKSCDMQPQYIDPDQPVLAAICWISIYVKVQLLDIWTSVQKKKCVDVLNLISKYNYAFV